MPKKFLKKYLPHPHEFKKHGKLDFLGDGIYAQNLWHLNRHSVAGACWIGVFCSFIPAPFQMIIAAVMALFAKKNMPLSVGLVWISNPITWIPIFYPTYKLGTWILGIPEKEFTIELTVDWAMTQLADIWQPLYLGSLIAGLFFATLSFFIIKFIWRWHIIHHWHTRRKKRSHKH